VPGYITIPRDVFDRLLAEVQSGIASCDEVARLRVELVAFRRQLRELDQELTPVNPPSRTDIKAAFDNSVEFASGRKKPPPDHHE
jgi:hypothetical protein